MNLDLTQPEVKADILKRINNLTPSSTALWGKMNVSQMLAHCKAQIKVALGDDKLSPSWIGKLLGSYIKKKVLTDKPYSQGLPTPPSFKIKNTPDFETAKNELIHLITRFNETSISKEPHPFFGKMTVEEWAKGTWKHLDHHLKQFGV